MKNLHKRQGWINRHLNGLPQTEREITIIYVDVSGESKITGLWTPFDKTKYSEIDMPADGYLGTFRSNIGFHAWEQNDSEFVYYKVV